MNKIFTLSASVALTLPILAAPTKKMHVPERLDDIRLISPISATKNHIAAVDVANAIPQDAWSLAVNYASSRLQLNVWTNSIDKSVFPAAFSDATLIAKTLGEKAKVSVFFEDTDAPYDFVSVPGKWCRVNVRFLKADKPDKQTLLDRYAKVILKGFVYACGGGAALDGRSSSCYSTNTLKGLDNAGITVSPDSYFPMLEVLRLVGGDEILSPAVAENEGE